MYLNDFCTVPMSLAGIPAISIPNGLSEGLPVGFQLAGPAFSENRILDAAYALEQAIGFDGSRGRAHDATTSPSSAWRSTSSSARGRRCSAAASCRFGEPPNTRTCPVCLGLPGTLPVANAEAIHYGLMIGLALGCEIAPRSIFHRKNYFYPDLRQGLPDLPVRRARCAGAGGWATCASTASTSRRTRPSSSTSAPAGASTAPTTSIVDFNRGGTPLVEIVTEPDVHSAEQAREWLRLLRATLRQLGVSDVNMEEGSLRCDANVSIRPVGTTRARHQDRAQEHELVPLRRAGHQRRDRAPGRRSLRGRRARSSRRRCTSTRAPRRSRSLRSKEEAHDYRYFPEPDLVPLADQRGDARARRAPRCPSCRPRAPSASSATSGCRRTRARLLACARRAGRLLRGGRSRATASRPSRWPTGSTSSSRASARGPGASRRSRPAALAKLVGLVSAKKVTQGAASRSSTGSSPTAATRRRSSSARASARSAAATTLDRDRRRPRSTPTRTSPSACAAAT